MNFDTGDFIATLALLISLGALIFMIYTNRRVTKISLAEKRTALLSKARAHKNRVELLTYEYNEILSKLDEHKRSIDNFKNKKSSSSTSIDINVLNKHYDLIDQLANSNQKLMQLTSLHEPTIDQLANYHMDIDLLKIEELTASVDHWVSELDTISQHLSAVKTGLFEHWEIIKPHIE